MGHSGSASPASSSPSSMSLEPTPVTTSYLPPWDTTSSVSSLKYCLIVGWFIFTGFLTVGTLRSSVVFFGLFFTLTMAFLMLAIGYYIGDSKNWIKAGGWFGLITALFAWYNAMAALWNPGNSFIKLPVGQFPWAEKGHPHVGRKPRNEKHA